MEEDDKVRELITRHTPEELARAYLKASRRASLAKREAEEANTQLRLMKMFSSVTIRK